MTKPVQAYYDMAQEFVRIGRWSVDPVAGQVCGVRGVPFCRMNSWGYVQIKFRDPDNWRREHAVLAHRVIWEAVHGPLSHDLTINHRNGIKTDNRLPNLEAVSLSENIQHAIRTGLKPVGVHQAGAVLTEADVLAIYSAAWSGRERHRSIAYRYGTDNGTVSRIKHGQSWASVTNHREAPAAA